MSCRLVRSVIVAVALAALAGCAPGAPGVAEPAVTPVPAAEPPPDPARPEPISTEPPAAPPEWPTAGELVVTGRIMPGAGPGCRLLRTSDPALDDDRGLADRRGRASGRAAGADRAPDFLLVMEPGEGGSVPMSRWVTVTGWVLPDLATTCGRGVPLVVSRIRSA